MAFIKFNNFRGVNTEDDTLAPNILTFGLNTDTQNGRLTKRSGTSALVKIGTTVTNLLTNGNFSDGIGNWTISSNLTKTIVDNSLIATSTDNGSVTFNHPKPTGIITDNKYWVYLNISSSTAITPTVSIGSNFNQGLTSITPNGGSGIAIARESFNFISISTNNPIGVGETVTLKDVVIVDLTATFGAGSEPTLEEADAMFKQEFFLIDIVNEKIPKGLHNARFQAGNTLVVGADDKAYKLTGSEEEIEVTSGSDFENFNITKGIIENDSIIANDYFKETIKDGASANGWTTVNNVRVVTTGIGGADSYYTLNSQFSGTGILEKSLSFADSFQINYRAGVRIFTSGGDELPCDITLILLDDDNNEWLKVEYGRFGFPSVGMIKVSYKGVLKNQISFGTSGMPFINFKVSKLNNVVTVNGVGGTPSSYNHSFEVDDSLPTKIRYRLYHAANWFSDDTRINLRNIEYFNNYDVEFLTQAIDLGSTPVSAKIDYNVTQEHAENFRVFVRGSKDGIRFGDFSEILFSGDPIMSNRFIQVRVLLDLESFESDTTSFDDFTLTFVNALDDYEEFDTGLTGNKIRWVNYQGQEKTTTGSITSGSTSLTVADGTGFSIGQTVFVEGAGSAGGYLEATVTNISGTTITLSAQASETVSDAFVRIDLYQTIYNVYYCDGTSVKKYDGTTVTAIGSVPASRIIYEHKGHMLYVPSVDPTRLYFSEVYGTNLADPLGDFESVPAQNFKQFPSEIKGLRTFEGKLVVSGDNFTAFIVGSIFGGTQDDTVVYIVDNVGVTNHESMGVVVTNQGTILALVTRKGVRYLTGGVYENALQQAPLSESVAFYLKDGSFDNSWLITHENKLYVGYDSGVLPPLFNDSVLVWDFRRGVIDGIWSLKLNDCAVFRNVLYGSSAEDGNLLELLTGSSDNGENIHMIAKMRMHMGEVKATAQNFNIKATTDSDIDNSTSAKIYVTLDKTKELDLKKGRWRKSNTILPQYKGQDLMEQVRNIKKRGTFIEVTVDIMSDKLIEFESFELEYEGVRT